MITGSKLLIGSIHKSFLTSGTIPVKPKVNTLAWLNKHNNIWKWQLENLL